MIEANLSLKTRKRGFTEGEYIEAIVLLQTAGGDCPEDARLLAGDRCLSRGLGFEMPKATALREFLERFHDESLEELRPPRDQQKSFILPPSAPLQGLQAVQAGLVRHIAALHASRGTSLGMATIDQDATLIESHKRSAQYHYEGGRGYQPMVAVWAEADLVVADEFRDGNVPARQAPLNCAKMAFEALPETIRERYFRGDSACHESELIEWLSAPERAQEPGGRIGFAVSAVVDKHLAQVIANVSEKQWQTYAKESDGTLRQWAELDFVPGAKTEHKALHPLRYVGLRLLKPQGLLFNDGSDRRHYAVLTNLDWAGDRLLQWHREKAGTVEHVHDEIKNALGGGHMPSQYFAVNAAWFKLSLMAYNLASAIKGACFSPEERTVRFKKYRLMSVYLAGRMSRNQCVLRLRFCATPEAIERMLRIWAVFDLPSQPTAFR